ncbi:MAG: hypothetical protein IJI03_12385 [Rudaea sp.]|nr:hypothetical protein [Rudaea sp.]
MEPEFLALVSKWGVGGAIAIAGLWGLSKALPQIVQSWFSTRLTAADSVARTDIIEQMNAQITRLSDSVRALEAKNEDERQKRILAEDKVATLSRRMTLLEDQIRALGAIPHE